MSRGSAVSGAALRRPTSILVYAIVLPAVAVALAAAHLYGQAAVCALLACQAILSLKIVDQIAARRFEHEVRAAAVARFVIKLDADAERVKQIFAHLPGTVGGGGYLYAVQFATGVVKIGRTTDPSSRLATHRRHAEAFGVAVTDVWLSPPHTNYQRNETALIHACMRVSGRYKNEYFHSIEMGTVKALASALTMKDLRAAAP